MDASWPVGMGEAAMREMMAQRVRQHLVQAAPSEPMRVARALDLAARSGVPVDVLGRDYARGKLTEHES